MRGAVYIRVSTNDQTEYSPEAQRKAIYEYAKSHDISITKEHIFIDDGFSGKRAEKRPGFMEMICKAKSYPKPFDIILVHRFDRFARNREDSVIYKSLLRREHGIRVISTTEHIEDDKFSVILESMLEGMAEYYSLNLADEVKKGMKEKASRGEFQTRPPYGYHVKERGRLAQHPDEARIVTQIFDDYVNKGKVFSEIARELNAKGYHTKSGGLFERRAIKNILKNSLYYGLVRWNMTGKEHGNKVMNKEENWIVGKGDFNPIISEDIWLKANRRMEREGLGRQERTWKNNSRRCKHWLRGLLRCERCGGTLVYGSSKGYSYYRCNNKLKGKCSHSQYISVKRIENMVKEQLEIDFPSTYDLFKKNEEASTQGLYNKKLMEYQNQIERAKKAYINGVDSLDEYEVNKSVILNQVNEIKELMEKEQISINEEPRSTTLVGYMNDNNSLMDVINKGLKSIVKEIQVDTSEGIIKFIYY